MVNLSRRRHNDVFRPIPACHTPPYVIGSEGGHGFLAAGHGLSETIGTEKQRRGLVDNKILRHVRNAPDFVDNDALLVGGVTFRQQRVRKHVGNYIQHSGGVLRQCAGVIAGVFLVGEGVQVAAQSFRFRRDFLRGPAVGALENHVLREVAYAGQPGTLVPRAGPNPHSQRHGFGVAQMFAYDGKAVGKACFYHLSPISVSTLSGTFISTADSILVRRTSATSSASSL